MRGSRRALYVIVNPPGWLRRRGTLARRNGTPPPWLALPCLAGRIPVSFPSWCPPAVRRSTPTWVRSRGEVAPPSSPGLGLCGTASVIGRPSVTVFIGDPVSAPMATTPACAATISTESIGVGNAAINSPCKRSGGILIAAVMSTVKSSRERISVGTTLRSTIASNNGETSGGPPHTTGTSFRVVCVVVPLSLSPQPTATKAANAAVATVRTSEAIERLLQ